MRRVLIVLCAAIIAVAHGAPAAAHTPGAQPVDKAGFFVLTADGTENATLHVFLTSFGLPIGANDTLEIHFIVNAGMGPPVNFEIHTHGGVSGYLRYFNASGANYTGSWKIPWNDSYMVWFVNPSPFAVNVTYSFVLFAPPNDLTPLIIFPLAIGGAVGWFLWLRAGREIEPEGQDEVEDWRDEPAPSDEAGPADQSPR